jgi:hypothetical protein
MTIISIQFGPRPEGKCKQATGFRNSRMARLGWGILTIATIGMLVFGADLVARGVSGYVAGGIEQFYRPGAQVPRPRL